MENKGEKRREWTCGVKEWDKEVKGGIEERKGWIELSCLNSSAKFQKCSKNIYLGT